jgi:hypothetical protein
MLASRRVVRPIADGATGRRVDRQGERQPVLRPAVNSVEGKARTKQVYKSQEFCNGDLGPKIEGF